VGGTIKRGEKQFSKDAPWHICLDTEGGSRSPFKCRVKPGVGDAFPKKKKNSFLSRIAQDNSEKKLHPYLEKKKQKKMWGFQRRDRIIRSAGKGGLRKNSGARIIYRKNKKTPGKFPQEKRRERGLQDKSRSIHQSRTFPGRKGGKPPKGKRAVDPPRGYLSRKKVCPKDKPKSLGGPACTRGQQWTPLEGSRSGGKGSQKHTTVRQGIGTRGMRKTNKEVFHTMEPKTARGRQGEK